MTHCLMIDLWWVPELLVENLEMEILMVAPG